MSIISRVTGPFVVAGTVALAGVLAGCTSSSALGPPVSQPVEVHRTQKPITIDGDVDDWTVAAEIRIARSDPPPPDARAKVAFCWDDSFLYAVFIVGDLDLISTPAQRDASTLHDDGVILLIDTHGDRTRQWQGDDIFYRVNLSGTVVDGRGLLNKLPNLTWNGGMKHAVTLQGTLNKHDDTDTGYIVEMAIPWADIGMSTPHPEDTLGGISLGVNFGVYGQVPNDADSGFFDWAKGPELFRPDTFGVIKLVK